MNAKILVVDDDPILMMSLKLRLAKAGFEVEEAGDGQEALGKVGNFDPDLILADIMMPRMDGYALHRELRKNPETASIPFIFLTAKSDTSDQLEGLRMGADDYVCKPFQISNLIERMRRVIDRAEKVKRYRVRADFGGNLSQMKWADIIQIVELNHKSGELVLRNSDKEKKGSAFFRNGKLVDAKAGPFEGREAFFVLMGETEGVFEFFGKDVDFSETIGDSNTGVLLQGTRLLDEYKNLRRSLPSMETAFEIVREDTPESARGQFVQERVSDVLDRVGRGESARQILSSGKASPLTIASILSLLLREKVVALEGADTPGIASVSAASFSKLEEGLVKALRIIQRKRLTGVLRFIGRRQRQSAFFKNGRMVHAFYGKAVGDKALFRIFQERGGTLKFVPQPIAVLPTIDASLAKLLREGNEEMGRLEKVEKGFYEKKVNIDDEKAHVVFRSRKLPGLRKFISLVKQHGKISRIVDASELTDSRTVEQLNYLIEIGLLRVEGKRVVPIQLLTDTTADIPPDVAEDRDIAVVPLSIHFGRTVYKDGVTVTPDSFYELLRTSTTFPHTSPPSLVEFHQLFKDISPERDILGIFLSRKMSKTCENALAVKEGNFEDYQAGRRKRHGSEEKLRIEIVDSRLVSLSMGLLVLEAAEKIREGWPMDRVVAHVEKCRGRIRTYFVVDTLEYLRRGGRIGKAQALIGQLLRFKPILGFENGEVAPVTRVRGGKNAQQRVIEIVREELEEPMTPIKVGLFHAEAPKWAERLKDLLDMNFNCQSFVVSKIGPTVGTHCGPGTVGVAYLPVEQENAR